CRLGADIHDEHFARRGIEVKEGATSTTSAGSDSAVADDAGPFELADEHRDGRCAEARGAGQLGPGGGGELTKALQYRPEVDFADRAAIGGADGGRGRSELSHIATVDCRSCRRR